MTTAYTDHVFQNVKLFIEGVQVPFISITVSNGIGGLPTAQITVPPQGGLLDIARFYNPKVHIFYTDIVNNSDPKDLENGKNDKLLFSGVISQVSYSKSKDSGASVGISFNCVHRYNFINDMIVDYTGWLHRDPGNLGGASGTQGDHANSTAAIIEALAGIKDPNKDGGTEITVENPEGQTNILPGKYRQFYNRLLGMPGILMNFWNQMKRSAFSRALRQGNLYYSEAFVRMYQPLTEDGLKFFDRLGGHYPIEAMVQADEYRVDLCPEDPGKKEKIVIPPSRQLFLTSAIQGEMTVSNISSYLQNSGEVTTIYQIFSNFYESVDYEIVTLASPAEVAIRPTGVSVNGEQEEVSETNETFALDTIVKPQIPFYFSPTCNVLFPGMYSRINVAYDEAGVPTRVQLKNLETPDENGFRTNFWGPHSIREAIAAKVAGTTKPKTYTYSTAPFDPKKISDDERKKLEKTVVYSGGYNDGATYSLLSTTGPSYGAIGIYEQGRGIKQGSIHLPRWLSHFSYSTAGGEPPKKDVIPDSTKDAGKYEALKALERGWAKRHPGDGAITLNPFAMNVDISAHQRLLFSAADYFYTQSFARTKMGSVECPFNPYIVPGYPMDVLESSPIYPSFHAMCSQVTHTFTATSASTTVNFVGAMTYTELANYYIPFVSPMIQVALDLADSPSLVDVSEKARITANEFYRYTLGTGAVIPQELLDFKTMTVKPKALDKAGGWTDGSDASMKDQTNGGELNPMLSYYGNLSLTYREIENRTKVAERFDVKFIEMSAANYGPKAIKYKDKELDNLTRYDIGRSQFLTYDTYFGQLKQEVTNRNVPTYDRGGNIIELTDLTKTVDGKKVTSSVKGIR